MTITVNYVSGVPGLGKTRAAIDFMRRHIEGGLAGKDVGYLFYVAPTVDLLNQTIKNLKALLDPALHVMIRAEYSIEGEQYNKKLGTVDTRIRAVLNDNRVGGKGVLPFCEGSILFMTHSSFIKLRK
ncbi:DEAD/DEAH box helicase, partial [Enterococcus faecalis]